MTREEKLIVDIKKLIKQEKCIEQQVLIYAWIKRLVEEYTAEMESEKWQIKELENKNTEMDKYKVPESVVSFYEPMTADEWIELDNKVRETESE